MSYTTESRAEQDRGAFTRTRSAASSHGAEFQITGDDKPALRQSRNVPTYESDHVSWLATVRQKTQEDPGAYARRYLTDGQIEFICLRCLKPICVVRDSRGADAGLAGHFCANPMPRRREESMTWLYSLRRAWLSLWRATAHRGIFARRLGES
jgi:hypothetical protein